MTEPDSEIIPDRFRAGLPTSLLFFGSGCAALLYETIWFQLLQFVIGSSAVSLGLLLGVFMGGMCLGSLLLPRYVSIQRNPLRVYAGLELALAVLGLTVAYGIPHLAGLYAGLGGPGLSGLLWRGILGALCLLPPTILMGATLPAVARAVPPSAHGASWLGWFYGANIAGAVFGCLLAGFYLLRVHDLLVATWVAAGLNVIVAAGAGLLSVWTPAPLAPPQPLPSEAPLAPSATVVYLAIGLSGACALSAEVVWTRLLSLILGPTVYSFSIILAIFLLGLGLGSSVGSILARSLTAPRTALVGCQFLLVAAVAWSAQMIARSIPFWPVNPSLTGNPWLVFQLDLARCAWALLPPTCLWGASFPLAVAAAAGSHRDAGRLAGHVYAANTLGAILGALLTSLCFISALGTQATQRGIILGSGLAALLLWLAPADRSSPPGETAAASLVRRYWSLPLALAAVVWLTWTLPKTPWQVVAYGRYLATKTELGSPLYLGEGLNASVAVGQLSNGVRTFHVSGKIEASSDARDMRLQRMLAHIPALLHPCPRSILVVGCGTGVTAGSFLVHPEVERVVICEIEPLVPKRVAPYFTTENYGVLGDPRVTVVYDDARHFILTTPQKFDVITSDPIHPWVKGAATLYTREYFELCRRHLNPNGLVSQWVPLYESDLTTVKSECATFFDAFPNGTLWSNGEFNEGYDLLTLGGVGASKINLDDALARLTRDDYHRVRESLKSIGCRSVYSLLANYAGRAADLGPWLADAPLNRDHELRLQYLAGLGLNCYEQDLICSDLLSHRRFPPELFQGTPAQLGALRQLIERPPATKSR